MSEPALRVEQVGKQYRIGSLGPRYATFRETLTRMAAAPWRRFRQLSGADSSSSKIWALRDVSFEVMPGEVIGIIGRNGAGKSTLLKILSQITEPTEGRVVLNGRVASLLEVGTGFHPELTGRENVFLNGAILGMSRREIHAKFAEIVAFAETEQFIDTPVKFYSSGMSMRLAFAVAAHLEPEILLVDEVLAVGDARFQRKCLSKIEDVSHGGRTVLFVSHNMPAVTRLCPRTILLENGCLTVDGPSPKVTSAYLSTGLGTVGAREWNNLAEAPGNDIVRLCAVRVRAEDGRITDAVDIRRPTDLEMEYLVSRPGHNLHPNFHFFNEEGVCVFITGDLDPTWYGQARSVGRYVSRVRIPGNLLAEGTLIVRAVLSDAQTDQVYADARDAVAFQIIDTIEGDSARGDYAQPIPGIVRPLLSWQTRFDPSEDTAFGPIPCGGKK